MERKRTNMLHFLFPIKSHDPHVYSADITNMTLPCTNNPKMIMMLMKMNNALLILIRKVAEQGDGWTVDIVLKTTTFGTHCRRDGQG